MEIEALYRAAIVALKNRQWEQATKNLLTVVNAAPQHRDASRVLMQLERLRPVSYWRGAFMFAIEHSAWDQAEAAAARLNEIDPALHNTNDVTTRLQELTAIGWYLPQSSPAQQSPLPGTPDPAPDQTLPPSAGPDPDAWLENLARRQEEQSLARPPLDDIITPHTLEIPLDRLASLDEAGEWHAPDPAPTRPASLGSDADVADEYVTPRALKAVEFSEVATERGIENQRGPIYDTLSTPRALKTGSFLDSVPTAKTAETAPPPLEPSQGMPPSPPPIEHQPTSSSDPAPEPLSPPPETPPLPEDAPPVQQVRPVHPPVTAAVDTTGPYHILQVEVAPAPVRAPILRLRYRLIVALLVAILFGTLVLITRLARNNSAAIPASVASTVTPAENDSLVAGEIPALIASLDLVLSVEQVSSEDAVGLDDLRDQIQTLTPSGSPLRNALIAWLDAGQQRLAAQLRLTSTCSRAGPDPDQCASIQTEYDLSESRTHLARNVVCILAGCPTD